MLGFRLYINNTEVDLKDDFQMSLNSQINDIRNPETKTTTYSKTVTIPASKSNVELFTYIYDLNGVVDTSGTVNFVPDFNPNLKADALALFDGVEVFRGIAQLTEIAISYNHEITFNIVLLGQLINLYKNIGDKELTDLDFSILNHDYTRAEIEASWTNTSGYVYPLIDYGRSQVQTDFPLTAMYPAIFVKDYIDRIFEDAGCVYDSDFFNTAFFGKLIIPFNGSNFKITEAEILDRKFRASRETTDQTMTVASTITNTAVVFNDDTTAPNFDSSAQFNTGSGLFTIGTGLQGNYNFGVNMDLTASYVPDTSGVAMKATQVIVLNVLFLKTDINSNTTILNTAQVRIRPLGFDITTSYETNGTYPDSDYSTYSGNVVLQSGQVEMLETETVRVFISHYYSWNSTLGALYSGGLGSGFGGNWASTEKFIDAGNNIYDGTYSLNVKIDSYFYNEIANADYVEGLSINMNNAVPLGIKQKDFLNSIIKMFNLYMEQDKEVSNKFIIEPRDDYYYEAVSDTTTIDLTSKLDISQDLIIEPMGSLEAKKYILKYKEDKDYFNQKYLAEWGETYSERQIDVVNDFIKDTKTTDVIFSATPSVGNANNNRVIPRILALDVTGTVSPITSNIRILIYDGLKSSNVVWSITDSGGQTFYSTYPYAGMCDDPYDATVSLDWEVPDEIYWTNIFGTINYTNKNLYNQYYKRMISEITDRNSKIVTGYFDIRPFDYSELDFRKIYYFERQYFRLNRIIDYNPLSDGLTKLEFVKINRSVTTSYTYEEATDVYNEDATPRLPRQLSFNRNIRDFGVNISGMDNRIGGNVRSATINGDDNTVGDFSINISIIGNENEISGDSSGVVVIGNNNRVTGSNITLINTHNKTINTSNTTFIDGRAVSGNGSIRLITSTSTIDKNADDDATTYLVDATSGNITINLFTAADFPINIPHNFKKIDATANTVTIEPFGSETIDGSSNYVISTQYDNLQIISDGQNFWII